jgi:hypothetical protein
MSLLPFSVAVLFLTTDYVVYEYWNILQSYFLIKVCGPNKRIFAKFYTLCITCREEDLFHIV